MRHLFFPVLLSSFFCLSTARAEPAVKLQPIYTNLEIQRPVALVIPDDGTKRRFLVEQRGKIRILPNDETASEAKTFMDFAEHMAVHRDFEEGLLGLAFHPRFKENGKFYVYYSKQAPKRSILSEFQVSKSDPDSGDFASERVLMEIQQPDWNHNSGNLLFEPETGFLFVAVGDGGRKNGVFLLAQNMTRWNGKILRIDVDGKSPGREYAIPQGNPFINDKNACPEIWAYGLRNPWGCAIDRKTGLFYMADVGQDLWEEINIIKKGGNYGWEHREGAQDFEARQKLMDALGQPNKVPKGAKFIDPIHQYDHSPAGGMSITGGYVYQGKAIPEMAGHFIYGDWRSANMWALKYDPESEEVENHVIHTPSGDTKPEAPTGFYPDENGEPIVLDWHGRVYRMVNRSQ